MIFSSFPPILDVSEIANKMLLFTYLIDQFTQLKVLLLTPGWDGYCENQPLWRDHKYSLRGNEDGKREGDENDQCDED